MKLVADWREGWRWFSAQALASVVALQGALAALPLEAREWVIPPTPWTVGQALVACSVAIAVLGFLGRFVEQPPKEKDLRAGYP